MEDLDSSPASKSTEGTKEIINILVLPEELKLKILSYLDYRTIRFVVSQLNKEFNRLSKDFSLYQRYRLVSKSSHNDPFEHDSFMSFVKHELSDPIFRENLTHLILTANDVDIIREMSFEKLQVITVHDEDFDDI